MLKIRRKVVVILGRIRKGKANGSITDKKAVVLKVRIKRKKDKTMERERRNQRSTFSAIIVKSMAIMQMSVVILKCLGREVKKHNLCVTLMMKKQ